MFKKLSSNFPKGVINRGSTVSTEEHREDLQRLAAKEFGFKNKKCEIFSYETLVAATDNFNPGNKCDSFRSFYKVRYLQGKLNDGREVEVDRLPCEQGRKEFIKKAKLLSSLQHPNVLNLFGYCEDNNKLLLLVYEYVPNKSLGNLLFGPNGRKRELDWTRTYDIIVGIARGLSYLHGNPQNCIIHCDIKPASIMLDHKWVPKISDLGNSRPLDETQVNVSGVFGTYGYMAPEYIQCGHMSVKADVYSFGVLLLELISGKSVKSLASKENNFGNRSLIVRAQKLYEENRSLELLDPTLADSVVTKQLTDCIMIGLECTKRNPVSRPSMCDVVFMLPWDEGLTGIQIDRERFTPFDEDALKEANEELLFRREIFNDVAMNSSSNSNQIMEDNSFRVLAQDVREEHRDEKLQGLAARECEIFSLETLLAATDHFHPRNYTQNGDYFRSICKGKLTDGREVEVERLTSQTWNHGREESIEKAELLRRLQHPNVVKLIGYCADNNQFLLVYEYVPNSLHQLLFSPSGREQLNWTQRYEIIKGTVNGLIYLHGGSQNGIIFHGDISTRNIFLDHDLKPIIGSIDIGRRRYSEAATPEITWTSPPALMKRWAPVRSGYSNDIQMLVKTDVYNFGEFLWDVISTFNSFSTPNICLLNMRDCLNDRLSTLRREIRWLNPKDPTNSVVTQQVKKCIEIIELCIHDDPNLRPNMSDVLSKLPQDQGLTGFQLDKERSTSDDNKVEESINFGSEILLDMPLHGSSNSNSNQIMKQNSHSNSFKVYAQDDREGQEDDMSIHSPSISNQIMEEDLHINSFRVPAQDGREGQKEATLKKKIDAQNCHRFSYEALHDATNGFASQNKLGEGAFGHVYKGKLDDGREIAVKKSSNMLEQQRESLIIEVELLSTVKHPNLVKLFGYCDDNNEFLLVYEYVPNKSLNKLLFGPNGREQMLDWNRTYGIIKGIARGLHYLHSNPQNCIIHRDIKPDNVLLDHKWAPKISDFGISRLFEEDQTHVYTRIVGTWGYIAPEYLDTTHVSIKTDVYSFGVLVLELVSGRRYSFMPPPPEDKAIGLLDWVYKLFKASKILEIMDPALANSAIIEQVKKCIKMGLLCTQGLPDSRPDMEQCVFMLTDYWQEQSECTISRPGIFGYRGYRSGPLSALVEATQNQA